jgi:dethiobiotin synthetase
MKKFNVPILLVSSTSLGTINHTLLTLREIRRHGLDVLGVVMNGESNLINRAAIESYGNVNVIAEIGRMADINPKTLTKAFKNYFSINLEYTS